MSDQLNTQVPPQASEEITLRDIVDSLRGLVAHWPMLMLSACLGLVVAFVLNRYTADTFKVSATVAVKETDNPLASSIDGMLNLGFGGNGIVDTRIAVLKSFDHNVRVAQNLKSGLILFKKGRLNKREVYKPDHFSVEFDRSHDQLLGAEFSLTFEKDVVELDVSRDSDKLKVYNFDEGKEVKSEDLGAFRSQNSIHAYGEWIEHPLYRFRIHKGPGLREFLSTRQP